MFKSKGPHVGDKAIDFTLKDQDDRSVTLSERVRSGAVLLAFYPGDFTQVCTKQLCSYRDISSDLSQFRVQILGLNKGDTQSHKRFKQMYQFPFSLLSDSDNATAKAYGCTSGVLLGAVSRALVLVDSKMIIRYKYVEVTPLSHRKADEIKTVIETLAKDKGL